MPPYGSLSTWGGAAMWETVADFPDQFSGVGCQAGERSEELTARVVSVIVYGPWARQSFFDAILLFSLFRSRSSQAAPSLHAVAMTAPAKYHRRRTRLRVVRVDRSARLAALRTLVALRRPAAFRTPVATRPAALRTPAVLRTPAALRTLAVLRRIPETT
jgi:hypothetical protein